MKKKNTSRVKNGAINTGRNHDSFFARALMELKFLMPAVREQVTMLDVMKLIKAFGDTWVSLDAYDKDSLPKLGVSRKQVVFTANELSAVLAELKKDLIRDKAATEIFGRERQALSLEGIVGNVFQSVDGRDAYPSLEEKAAHLFYFIVKNHPFVDGNKRCGAFAFVWFLSKAGILRASLTPGALTTLTLLVAESAPKDKERIIGLVLMLLGESNIRHSLSP